VPEIAEVRHLVGHLNQSVIGVNLLGGSITHQKLWDSDLDWSETWKTRIRKIQSVDRRGKYVIIVGEAGTILTHLGFTGWYVPSWNLEGNVPRRFLHPVELNHSRAQIETEKGPLHLVDPRALSRTRFFNTKDEALESRYLNRMSPDADTHAGQQKLFHEITGMHIGFDANFEPLNIPTPVKCRRSGRKIRDFILDQKVVGGIGNYLCCESLHRANLHGSEIVSDMSLDQVFSLLKAIRETINLAMTSDNKDWWQVFQRKQTPDGKPVVREVWGTRGHYTALVKK
jgi:formamidopyrimidine-DNA glycosylase